MSRHQSAYIKVMVSAAEKAAIRTNDLAIIRDPYVILGFVVIAIMVIIALYKVHFTKFKFNKLLFFIL